MSQTLTYVIGQDRRPHVDNVQDFKVNFDGSNTNWVQARQYERSMRQVFVNIKNEDGTPLDLTGCNVWFEGLLPKNSAGDFRVIDDKGYVALDPTAGRFRFDMPGHAFTVAGSYRQAFFRILKDGNSITTLEFDLDVLADKVIDGLVPRTYISPVEELINEIEAKYQDSTDKLTKMTSDFVDKFAQSMNTLKALGVTVQNGLDALEAKIKQDNLFTQAEADAFKQLIVQMIKTQTINVFDSVDDMKHNASSLVEGMKVRTLSYYNNPADPYGGCLYKVCTTKTNLPAIDLGNGLYAVPILEHSRVMNAACFGIKVNAEDDQADAIQNFLNSVPYNYKAYFPAGSYVLEHGIKVPSNREIFGDTTNTLNASWNGTGFFFKNLAENTVAIDAHTDGKQTVHNLWVQIEGAYSFSEDRTKAKITTDNKMISPFNITKTVNGIIGIYIGGYGSIAKDNVVVGASEAGIDSDAFCQIRDNQVWDSSIGIRTKSDMQVSGNRVPSQIHNVGHDYR